MNPYDNQYESIGLSPITTDNRISYHTINPSSMYNSKPQQHIHYNDRFNTTNPLLTESPLSRILYSTHNNAHRATNNNNYDSTFTPSQCQQIRNSNHRSLNNTTHNHITSYIGHADDFLFGSDVHDDSGLSYDKAMIAGAVAGVSEHLVMFPVDTIKTRLQAYSATSLHQPQYTSVYNAASTIIRNEGILRLYRGIPAVVAAAIPSHAMHYATYEYFKNLLGGNQPGHHMIANGSAGAIATMVHDAIVTPLDVVKQRLQLCNSPYRSVTHCVQSILAEEGIHAFYASYPTTVLMNVPFMAVHFGSYESFKLLAMDTQGIDIHGPVEEIIAGGLSGAMAGLISNPFDVIKTRIQTQSITYMGINQYTSTTHTLDTPATVITHGCSRCSTTVPHAHNMLNARQIASQIYQQEGLKGFMRGASARVIYFVPSAAICWTTYETTKRLLKTAW